MINVMKPKMPNSAGLLGYLKQIDEAGVYSNFGPLSKQLIARLSDYFGVDQTQIVLMSNATLALQGSITILSERGAGRDISMPSWTFTASASAAVLSGCNPLFVDVDEDWRVMDSVSSDFAIDVLPFGDSLRHPGTSSLKAPWQVIDGAASFDSLYKGVGNLPNESVLVVSMHATKLLGAGEGGICIASSIEIANELRVWSNFGFDGTRESRRIGTNSKISEYAAAVALASLDSWPETREILEKNRLKALEISNSLGLSVSSSMTSGFVSPYWIVKFDSPTNRELVETKLWKNNIETRHWWAKGCHAMEAYKSIKCSDLSNTIRAAEVSLGLPFHAYLTNSDFDQIFRVLSDT
jgi:dTDP-4-amino-4,6-dideoxygalactose transaminase